jgi:hypothetical protein
MELDKLKKSSTELAPVRNTDLTESVLPNVAMSKILVVKPDLTKHLTESELPRCTASNADTAAPKRAKPRIDSELPRTAFSITD